VRQELVWLNSGIKETSKSKDHYDPSEMGKIGRIIDTARSNVKAS